MPHGLEQALPQTEHSELWRFQITGRRRHGLKLELRLEDDWHEPEIMEDCLIQAGISVEGLDTSFLYAGQRHIRYEKDNVDFFGKAPGGGRYWVIIKKLKSGREKIKLRVIRNKNISLTAPIIRAISDYIRVYELKK